MPIDCRAGSLQIGLGNGNSFATGRGGGSGKSETVNEDVTAFELSHGVGPQTAGDAVEST